jgi:hypothetical protein
MTREQLIRIDNDLDVTIEKDSILISKRGFYIYYNEPNKNRKEIIIHSHICGNCAWGSGKITNKEVGLNGVWIGPFQTSEQARFFGESNFVGCVITVDTCVGYHPNH